MEVKAQGTSPSAGRRLLSAILKVKRLFIKALIETYPSKG